jgi:hypothetical protein
MKFDFATVGERDEPQPMNDLSEKIFSCKDHK